jgi:hypothetical protein
VLEFEDMFDGGALDERRRLRHHLPQWRIRERYAIDGGCLRLIIG